MRREIPKTAVITGAGSGIGRAVAVALGQRGWKVGVLDIDADGALRTVELVEAAGGSAESFRCDVANLADVEAAAEHFFSAWAGVGMLVNNAGIGGGGYVGETSIADWERVVAVNLWGVLHGCHAFIPRMKAQGRGYIVNTASTAGLMPQMMFAPYDTTKAAVVGLSETLKVELAPFNIGVTVLCPSCVKTNIVENSLKQVALDSYEERDWGMGVIQAGLDNSSITPEDVAEMLIRGIENDRLYVLTSGYSKLVWSLIRLSPQLYYRLWAWLSRTGRAKDAIMGAAKRGQA